MLRFAFRFMLFFLVAPHVLSAEDTVTLTLKEEAMLRSTAITLKDVVDLRSVPTYLYKDLEKIRLGTAPEDGSPTLLSRSQISECLKGQSGLPADTIFAGSEVVRAALLHRRADPSILEPTLKSHLLDETPWKGSDLEIISIGGISAVEIPDESYEVRLSSKPSIAGPSRLLVAVEINQAGRTLRRFWITTDVVVRASVVTAARPIAAETIITADDVKETVIEIPDLRARYVRRAEELLGKASSRLFSAGDPLISNAFADPLLVRRGETVQLRLERSGIVLTSLVKAEQDGKLGQSITVRNLDFSSTLKAEVTGRASVRVQ